MSCEYCGALMDHGSLLCMKCGSERREAPARSREPARRAAPEIEVQAMGPSCDAHPGLPVLGNCPRCGKPVCFRCAPGAVNDVLTCNDCLGMTAAHRPVPSGARCAVHPATGASFICARCGSFACAGCKSWGSAGYCVKCQSNVGTRATRSARFTANLVDNAFIVLIPVIAIAIAAVAASNAPGESEWVLFAGAGASVLIACAAQLWAQVTWGQSIGKRLTGIKVVRTNGDPIELWRVIILRNVVVHVVAQACGIIGLADALMIFTDDQRCLHDYLADSIVVEAPKP